MSRPACLLATIFLLCGHAAASPPDGASASRARLPDGVYAVRRDGPAEKDVLPLWEGEVLAVDRHPYLNRGEREPPRFLVVGSVPDVALDLAGEPKAVKEREGGVGILLKLRPGAARALEGLTRDRPGRQLAVVVGGEVATVHKVRAVIRGGEVQITSCAAGGAEFVLRQLQTQHKKK